MRAYCCKAQKAKNQERNTLLRSIDQRPLEAVYDNLVIQNIHVSDTNVINHPLRHKISFRNDKNRPKEGNKKEGSRQKVDHNPFPSSFAPLSVSTLVLWFSHYMFLEVLYVLGQVL